MKTIIAVLFVLVLASFAQAQQRWTRTYGGTKNDGGWSVQPTSDGGYIVAGYTASFRDTTNGDVYLIKTNASGDTLWTRIYGGASSEGGEAVQPTSNGGYIIAGFTVSSRAGGYYDVYLIKTDASGETLWTRTYGGTNYEASKSVQQTLDGGYIVAGYSYSFGAGLSDVYLIKTNASGASLWTRTYGGTSYDFGQSVQQTSDSGYIVAGSTYSFGAGNYDVWLIKTDASGDTIWTRTYGGTGDDRGYSVEQTSDGGYIVAGYTKSFGSGLNDVYLIKTNSSGDTLWTRTYGGVGDDEGYSVQQTSDGGYVVAGYTKSFGAGQSDVWLIKTNASGDILWTRTYGGVDDDYGYAVRQTSDAGYIVAGFTASFVSGNDDVYLIKTDANGNAGAEEPGGSRQKAAGSMEATPNPFASFARIPGHEAERLELYDVSGKKVGAYRGSRIGEGLPPAVYFIKLGAEHAGSLRIVKVR